MKLLQELSEDVQVITEGEEGHKKKLYIEGVFMQCIPNRNGRIYPEATMSKEVGRYLKEMVNANRAVGELDHPPNPKINGSRISHRITSLKMEGKNVMGRALILDTHEGMNARGLIEGGVQVGVSSRGLGTLKDIQEGLKEVQDDFHLITAADIVMDPSAPDAFVTGIMEGVDWFFDPVAGDWKRSELAESTKKTIKRLNKRELEEAKLRLFENFLRLKS
jgi:hypothetical protein